MFSAGAPLSESTVRNFIRMYKKFSAHDQEEIGKFAVQHGLEKASQHFSDKLGFTVRKGLLRKFRKMYLKKMESIDELSQINECKRKKSSNSSGTSAKRSYSTQMKEEIGYYATQHGIAAAVQYFTEKLQFPVKESTIRKFKKIYIDLGHHRHESNNISNITSNSSIIGPANVDSSNCAVNAIQNVSGLSSSNNSSNAANISIATSAASNNFVYQNPSYSLNMTTASGANSSSTPHISLNQNTSTLHFPQPGVINQHTTGVPYQYQSQSAVLMNQSFGQQPQQQPQPHGNNATFHQNYLGNFSQASGLVSQTGATHAGSMANPTHVPPSTLAHNAPTSSLPQGQHLAPSSHVSQQGQQILLQNQQHSQHSQLLTCYHNISPGQLFEGLPLASEPLCLLKESHQQLSSQHQQPSTSSQASLFHKLSSSTPSNSPGNSALPSTCLNVGAASVDVSADQREDSQVDDSGEDNLSNNAASYSEDGSLSPPLFLSKNKKSKFRSRNFKGGISRRGNYMSYSPEERAAIGKKCMLELFFLLDQSKYVICNTSIKVH